MRKTSLPPPGSLNTCISDISPMLLNSRAQNASLLATHNSALTLQNHHVTQGLESYMQHGSILLEPRRVTTGKGEGRTKGEYSMGGILLLKFSAPRPAIQMNHSGLGWTELLAFLGGHLFPPLHHAVPPVPVATGPATESTEEDLAKNQKSYRLPEVDRMQAEESRQ